MFCVFFGKENTLILVLEMGRKLLPSKDGCFVKVILWSYISCIVIIRCILESVVE